jgi:hypothetical protein
MDGEDVTPEETPAPQEQDGIDVHAAEMAADGDMKSRKFLLTLLAMALIVICGVLSGWLTGLAATLSIVVGGILGALGIYAGANVSTKWAAASIVKSKAPPKV